MQVYGIKYLSLAAFLLVLNSSVNAQAFGFGCLGFVGGYGGYSMQRYEPTGLNNYIQVFNSIRTDSLTEKMPNFGTATGYRAGVNFFRANFSGFILTFKGFYQALREKKSAQLYAVNTGVSSVTYQLDIKGWGAGIDLGTTIIGGLSWKVIDAAVTFNSLNFKTTTNNPSGYTVLLNYATDKPALGYSIGTGFIFDIIEDYISIEGLAGYSVFSIDTVQLADGTILSLNENSAAPMKDFIKSGGFNAVVQLNIGFPF